MSKDEFQRALGYSNSAMSLLKRGSVPPYPQFYELFYTYSTGVNTALNNKINELLADGKTSSISMAEQLYNEFLRARGLDARINAVTEQMSKNIDSVHSALNKADKSANKYAGSLETAADVLGNETDPEALKALAMGLLAETRKMQETNRGLKNKLNTSRSDIALLQQDLKEVERESMTDALTKIYNRKYFDLQIEKLIAAASLSGEPLCLVMVDIDLFKRFNDTYGHQTGDQVLRLVAMTMRGHTKGNDVATRFGGEEFAIILPGTDIKGAMHVSEKIRNAIQTKELLRRSTNEQLGRITASFGVSQLRETDTSTTLIERADRALYAAKRNGRNCVEIESDKTEKAA